MIDPNGATVNPWLVPEWPAPAWVQSLSTLRWGGVSRVPFQSLNLGEHVGDRLEDVVVNRRRLLTLAHLPSDPVWLNQTHSNHVLDLDLEFDADNSLRPAADASFTMQHNRVSVVMTADCLPVLLTNRKGSWVAAVHAGWRGLADRIIAKTVARYSGNSDELIAWLGPAIGPSCFEVGNDVRQRFIDGDPSTAGSFQPKEQKFLADLYQIARLQLTELSVEVFGGNRCTYLEESQFFSYRRDGQTGRMATLIWMTGAYHDD